MCNRRKYITYTLQHGISNGTYDYVEYKCSHAKYFLAWGEYTKWTAMKYGMQEPKIKVVGSMIQLNEKEENTADRERTNCFLVCTNGVDEKSAWNRNNEIIILANQIAEKYNMQYCLKVHPYDNVNRYRRITKAEYCKRIAAPSERVEDLLKSVDFTLCGNSTTFCDSLYYKVPAFRYIEANDARIDVCKGIKFGRVESFEQLEKGMTTIQKERSKYMIRLMKNRNLLFHVGNISKEYLEAINGK